MTEVAIDTSLLYGIFVGAKSFLIGTRFLVGRVHIETLLNKILRSRLPQELIDLIVDELHLMNQTDILARWQAGPNLDPAEDTFYDFLSTPAIRHDARPPRYPVEQIVFDSFREHANVIAIWITTSRPGSTASGEPLEKKTYLHLSAFTSEHKPTLAWNLRPNKSFSSFANTGAVSVGKKGRVTSRLHPGQNVSPDLATDSAVYLRKPQKSGAKARRSLPEVQTTRLLQCENVEGAIRNWDAEGVKAYVDLLGLKLVPFDEGDPMKPGLHIWQRISDCVDS